VHGTLHAYFKDDALASAPKKADGSEADKFPFSQQQYGFTLGGPIVKDRMWFFAGYNPALERQVFKKDKYLNPPPAEAAPATEPSGANPAAGQYAAGLLDTTLGGNEILVSLVRLTVCNVPALMSGR
jgi:hypothetical protein